MNESNHPRICVYAGSRAGNLANYGEAAEALGLAIARRGYELVYGGGSVGLMGIIADTVLGAGGRVTGIIPEALERREVAHRGLTTLEVVRTMHERKHRMAELAQGFIALPGGLGTLEELFEALTLTQLGYQQKPVGLLNCMGYYDPLSVFLEHAVRAGFVAPAHRALLLVDDESERLLARLGQANELLRSSTTAM